MTFLLRRCLETLGIMFVSSFPMLGLVRLDMVIPENDAGYAFAFCVGALIFWVFSAVSFRAHLIVVEDIKIYFAVNGLLLLIQVVVAITAVNFLSNQVFIMLFGYTRAFNKTLGVTKITSIIIVYIINALEILIFPLDRWRIRRKIDNIKKMMENMENEDL